MAPFYSVPCSPQSSTKSHQASRRAPQGVEWALCRTYSVHFCQLSNGGTYFLVATCYTVLSHGHCPPGCRQHLWGMLGISPHDCLHNTHWRRNSPTEVHSTRPCKISISKIYSRTGDTYTVYTCTKSHPISNVKDTTFTSMFWPP